MCCGWQSLQKVYIHHLIKGAAPQSANVLMQWGGLTSFYYLNTIFKK